LINVKPITAQEKFNFPKANAILARAQALLWVRDCEQSGKVEYERESLLGIANKLMNFQSDSQQPFALVFDFSALLVDNLN
jgi:hypothetical protein